MKKLFLAASFSLLGVVAINAQQTPTQPTDTKPVQKEVNTSVQKTTTTETVKMEPVQATINEAQAEVKAAEAEVDKAKTEINDAKKEAVRDDKKKKKKEKVE